MVEKQEAEYKATQTDLEDAKSAMLNTKRNFVECQREIAGRYAHCYGERKDQDGMAVEGSIVDDNGAPPTPSRGPVAWFSYFHDTLVVPAHELGCEYASLEEDEEQGLEGEQ